MKIVPITKGREIIVDDEDFHLTQADTYWFPIRGHIQRKVMRDGKRAQIQLGKLILGDNNPQTFVKYKNGNFLDLRKDNLILAKKGDMGHIGGGGHNTGSHVRKTVRGLYIGVTPNKRKFKACIMKNKKMYYIGLFPTAEDAAFARDLIAYEMYGDAAQLNFPEKVKNEVGST